MSAFRKLLQAISPSKPVDLAGFPPQNNYTPDWPMLETYKAQRLFVYNDLMQGFRNYRLIYPEGEFCASAFTEDMFSMWKKKLGKETYPIPLDYRKREGGREDWYNETGQIKGELYLVRPRLIKTLDELAENGVQFIRRRVPIMVPYQHWVKKNDGTIQRFKSCEVTEAWMYVGAYDYWHNLFDNGFNYSLVNLYQLNNAWVSRYFYFDKMEYDV